MVVISITYSGIAPLMMGFSTIGLCLYYIAYRYNLLFVNNSVIDTKGAVYPKALKHTLVGCYLSVICLIGLFAIQAAAAALALMVIFLVFMILFHIALLSAINPLLEYLPRSLEAEETALLSDHEGIRAHDGAFGKNTAQNGAGAEESKGMSEKGVPQTPKVSFMKKWLRPDIYCSYQICRKMVPQDFGEIIYTPETERDAYQHPAVKNITPLLWIPRDEMGISRQECAHTNMVTPMTDEGAYFNEKGKIVWDQDALDGRAPISDEKIYY